MPTITCHLRYVFDPGRIAEFKAYEQYRIKSLQDPECSSAFTFAKETKCLLSYARTFFRPRSR